MGNVPIRIEKTDDELYDYTIHSLRVALRETRSEKSGSPIQKVAKVIDEELTKEEIELLVLCLNNLSK